MPRENPDAETNILSRTHIRRNQKYNLEWHWVWRTEAPNGNIVAVGGEGYDRHDGALNGFLSNQGHGDWTPGQPLPEGYVLEKFAEDHYVVTKFKTDNQP